mmetsp:Transcript_46528/g.108473  ORF Transcript_46528/g.108473 Transcript_46528/m.108473 type:complete len:296 (-) Transcript_46528:1392-2279(-)
MLPSLLCCLPLERLVCEGLIFRFDLFCPLVDALLLLLTHGSCQVVYTLALKLPLADPLLPLLELLGLLGLLNLIQGEVRQVSGSDLIDLLASHLHGGISALLRLLFHLSQHLLGLLQLHVLAALFFAFLLPPLAFLFLTLALKLGFTLLLFLGLFMSLSFLLLFLALALLLAALNLLLSAADLATLFLDALSNVLREQNLLGLLLLELLLWGYPVHRLLQLVANLNERLLHALHIHLPGSTKDDGLFTVVDLHVDALSFGSLCQPFLCNVEGNNGCGFLKVFDGHIGIDLRELLH